MNTGDLFCNMADGRRICYRSHGPDGGETLILVVGLGLQLTYWPQALIDGLVEAGLRVVVLDNRDAGQSSFTDAEPPSTFQQLLRRPTRGYDLGHMASDVVGLMDALSIASAHVMGMSMGGMIAQTLAARHAERMKSLTSVFSTTGSLKVGQPALKSILQLIRRPPRDQREAARDYVDLLRVVGSSLEWSEPRHRQYAEQAWERGGGLRNNVGTARQIGAIINSGDRTAELGRVRCPTLVIHGDRDLMVATSGGYATAAAIGGARLVILPGMGHDIAPGLVNILVDLIAGHVRSCLRPAS
ncbi:MULTISPECIES: alpha/beta hydrolase [Delftia]|jgi:pimeloyl-ACP methyl ester carboxylesterase|uniref:Alpha/beta hydrolase n=2 Tax=Delftia TaxID=80865 RepID=A0AAX3STR4_9BURK|nr:MULTISPECIES: alpha/beta hydrolase [Delftia]AOV01460.1 alpha/beta hydrolase [Delftia tsuruhatensis]EPD42498.1 hypothetical protein HMPREF9702_02691 [Delftia acidovorans CCUG 15835]EPD44910.1 hypothetical protein HMPREF9701_00501 [Delftia acidovorans CCUG 274B]KAF1044389.1 MAG: Aclacinomycin methylesterase RdmC [Delftia tsuruhatensis]MBS3722412.1 Aclacinomycin methylesterase RdmC [Delftia sp. PE138]